jgi:putative spermidine/putrescine transport system permease protein
MAIAVPLNEGAGPSLKQRLKHAERVNRWKAQALIAPLALFLLLVFLVPIAALLYKSVGNPEVVDGLPRTVEAISSGTAVPAGRGCMALSQTSEAQEPDLGDLSKRLNMELAGYRSLLTKTARALPLSRPLTKKRCTVWTSAGVTRPTGRPSAATPAATPFYLLAAIDHRVDDLGELAGHAGPGHLPGHLRPHPLDGPGDHRHLPGAGLPAGLPAGQPAHPQSNLLMILVLLPFWTSILVRVAAWIVLLQSGGLINSALMAMGMIDQPLELVFNRTGVYISMVHILLPFMILPLYSVMKGIRPAICGGDLAGLPPVRQLLARVLPADLPVSVPVPAGVHPVHRLLHHPGAAGQPERPDGQLLRRLLHQHQHQLGHGHRTGRAAAAGTVVLYMIYSWLVGASRLRLS